MKQFLTAIVVIALLGLVGCGRGKDTGTAPEARKLSPEEQKAVAAVVASAKADDQLYQAGIEGRGRTDSARQQDAYRKPQQVLALMRITPGMVVADASGSDSYLGDILAGVPGEKVRVIKVGTDAGALAALQPGSVDVVLSYLAYHEMVAAGADRTAWLNAARQALKTDGALLVMDYAAEVGTGDRDTQRLGRIDEQQVQQEAEAVGFDVEEFNGMFRNGSDDRTGPSGSVQPQGSADQFALRFRKPPE